VLSAEGLRILDDDGGELGTTGFFDDPAQTIALLTETFGSEPEQVPYPGHIEAAPGIDYVWGGFTFRVQEFEPDPPMWPNQTVIVEGAVVSGVEIRTPGGFGIGTPSETLDASGAVGTGPYEDSEGNPQTFYEIDPVVVDTQEGYAYLNFLWVTVRDGVVIRISSPAANYGV
jgi:hypothetical protein